MGNTILALVYSLSLGFMPLDEIGTSLYKQAEFVREGSTVVDFVIGFDLFDCFTIYGEEKSKQYHDDSFSFMPYTQIYGIGFYYHHDFNDKLKLKVGLDRRCSHPLSCWGYKVENTFNTAECTLYVQVEGKIDLIRRKQ